MNNPLATGTVTFLFTDIQGSTPLWEQHPQQMAEALQIHHAALRQAIEAQGGAVFKTVGDAFQAAFPTAPQGLQAAIEGQLALQAAAWNELGALKVRMGLHTGEAALDPAGDEYAVSHTKNRIGRIHSVAHGGQILLSQETKDLVDHQLPPGVTLKDLGEQRLKGMQWLEHMYQVCAPGLPQEFPPLATALTRPNNLPAQLTSFIGREREVEGVIELLSRHRLVTLTGSGGTGKTRLSLQVASQVLDNYPNGVWLVELAPLSDPSLIPSSVATVFGLHPEAGRTALQALGDYFRGKRLLLVLDNCEHLIAEAAQFANAALQDAPGLKILATSREALGLAGETIYPTPSLEMPDPQRLPPVQSLADFEAVRLFVERACAVLPAFHLTEANAPAVALICQRLDGIPLAIELAAARVKVLSAEQIAARLDDRFRLLTGGSRAALPRHQTLHALIDWSYGLLSEAERELFRCLSVFRSGWTLKAAETVCSLSETSQSLAASAAEAVCKSTGQADFEVLDGLAGLVNKSLIFSVSLTDGTNRFRMLETIRQYAQDKLLEAGKAAAMRNRHLEYFVAFAEAMEKKLHSPDYVEAIEEVDAEVDNFRAALGWALGRAGDSKLAQGLRLAAALADYWYFRGLIQERDEWLSAALERTRDQEGLLTLRARAYLKAVTTVYHPSTSDQQLCSQSLALYRKANDRPGLALAQIYYGSMLSDPLPGKPRPLDSASGFSLIEEGSAFLEEIGDPWGLGWVYFAKSCQFAYRKDYAAQRKMLEKSLESFEQAGDILLSESYKYSLFYCTLFLRDYGSARRLAEQSLEFFRKVKHKTLSAYSLVFLGQIAHLQGDYRLTETCCQEALELFNDMGALDPIVWTYRTLACAVVCQGEIARASQTLLKSQSLGRKLPNGDPSGDLAFVLWIGAIAESLAQLALAARFLGAVEAVLETFFKPLDIVDQIEYDRLMVELRAGPDQESIQAAWAEGRKLTFAQALEEALVYCREENPYTPHPKRWSAMNFIAHRRFPMGRATQRSCGGGVPGEIYSGKSPK